MMDIARREVRAVRTGLHSIRAAGS